MSGVRILSANFKHSFSYMVEVMMVVELVNSKEEASKREFEYRIAYNLKKGQWEEPLSSLSPLLMEEMKLDEVPLKAFIKSRFEHQLIQTALFFESVRYLLEDKKPVVEALHLAEKESIGSTTFVSQSYYPKKDLLIFIQWRKFTKSQDASCHFVIEQTHNGRPYLFNGEYMKPPSSILEIMRYLCEDSEFRLKLQMEGLS